MNEEIYLKKATKEDIEFLFELRNRPETYEVSRNNRPVEKQEHINWITPILEGKRKNIFLYVIHYGKKRAGQLRFDLEDEKTAEVSISIMKEFFGKGIGGIALQKGILEMKEKGIKKIIAEVKKDNVQSIRFFEKNGFKQFKEKGDYLDFEYIIHPHNV